MSQQLAQYAPPLEGIPGVVRVGALAKHASGRRQLLEQRAPFAASAQQTGLCLSVRAGLLEGNHRERGQGLAKNASGCS